MNSVVPESSEKFPLGMSAGTLHSMAVQNEVKRAGRYMLMYVRTYVHTETDAVKV